MGKPKNAKKPSSKGGASQGSGDAMKSVAILVLALCIGGPMIKPYLEGFMAPTMPTYLVNLKSLPQSNVMSGKFAGKDVEIRLRPEAWLKAAHEGGHLHRPFVVPPAAHEADEEGAWEVYNYTHSFAPAWAEQDSDPSKSLGERRLINLHGVPFHVAMTPKPFLDKFGELRTHLLKMEKEWMKLPILDWKDKKGPSYNTTSARYDQFNVLTLADKVPIVGELKDFFKEAIKEFLGTMGRSPEFVSGSPYFREHVKYIEPMPLYIMCWCNFFYADKAGANSLHWHEHMWPFQGYLSVDSETSGTNFRSNVDVGKRWRFDHTTGMLFLLPGGTLHRSTPWKHPGHARITVAFNLAFYKKPGFVWEELFSKKEMKEMMPANDMRLNTWGMPLQRPRFPYSNCMVEDEGICPDAEYGEFREPAPKPN
jgi:hypothetical protein